METPKDSLTQQVIGAAIEVHRALGPGLLESAYEECLCHELELLAVPFRRQVPLAVVYKDVKLRDAYRMDLVVADRLIVELKAVEAFNAIHEAQMLSYLRLSGLTVGLLMNFHRPVLRDGIKRFVLTPSSSPSLSPPSA